MLSSDIQAFMKHPFADITTDSRNVKNGSLFIAYPGEHSDGRDYIAQAVAKGASAVMWEAGHDASKFAWRNEWAISHLPVEGLKQQVSEIAARFYGAPTEQCAVIGVTGTNGKTTVSQWVAQCLDYLGKKAAVVGTVGNGFIEDVKPTVNTTPDAVLLQKLLADYIASDADAVAMEVSSHGLDQGRVNGVHFDIAVLTNLSRDHLDYHKTMGAYAEAKRKLFAWRGLKIAVVNTDDAFGKTIAHDLQSSKTKIISYGFHSGVTGQHVQGHDLVFHAQGLAMDVSTPEGDASILANVVGQFNAHNVLAVLATLLSMGLGLAQAVEAIAQVKSVQGRMQQLGGGKLPLVVIDYAHTPDALEKVLVSLKQVKGKASLTCVFGCGGDRDVGKRGEMGLVAQKHADVVMVTSDNPRSEDPQVIIDMVLSKVTKPVLVEHDRKIAIHAAVNNANVGDVVLVAGKGHESYQEIEGVKHSFSDEQVVRQALEDYKVAA